MKQNKLIVLFSFCAAISAYAQNNGKRVNELVTIFQKNMKEGLDLTSFDTISNQTDKENQIDAFINMSKSMGAVAQTYAVRTIKATKHALSDDEMMDILFNGYKAKIPELKNSYLDYLKKKCKSK
jgi:uncharacterized protein YsxB (DUF464 family)